MILAGLIPLACSALLGLASPALRRWLPPGAAAVLLALAGLATALATGLVLCLAGFLALAQNPVVAALGGWRAAGLARWDQLPAGWAVSAGTAAAVLLASAVAYLARMAWDLARASRACGRAAFSRERLVISPDDRPAAFTVPLRGAIVVSAGMLRLLPADERRALLAHEAAHLRRGHAGYVLLASLAAAADPLLRPLAREVALAVELWADELAAREVGDGRVVARALARASLASAGPRAGGASLRLGAAESHVSARVRALTGGAPRRRPWAGAAAIGLAAAATVVAAGLATALHGQVESAQAAAAARVVAAQHRVSEQQSVQAVVHRERASQYGAPGAAAATDPLWTSLRVMAR